MDAGDLDGDEDLDIVMGLTGRAIAAVWINPGHGDFDDPTFYMSDAAAYTSDLTVADFDGDDDLDLATVRTLNVDPPWLLRNQGDGTFSPPELIHPEAFRYVRLASGDVDLDGDEDLAMITGLGPNRMEIFRNDGAGTFAIFGSYPLGSSESFGDLIVLADLDGDTAPEAIIPFRNGVSVRVLRNDGEGRFAPPDQYSVAIEPTGAASGDLDDDGDPDLAVTALTSHGISVLLNLSQPTSEVTPSPSDRTSFTMLEMKPNPAWGATTIEYRNPEWGPVRLALHDVSGRLIGIVLDATEDAGDHVLSWDGTVNGASLPAGRYILRLEAGRSTTIPVTLLR
jgi:hypothetical protein